VVIDINAAAAGEQPGRAWFAWRSPRHAAAKPRERAHRRLATSRLVVIVALLGVGLTLIGAGAGYGLARSSDETRAAEQRATLRGGIQEFRALFGDFEEADPRLMRMLEQSAGLKDLKFEAEPADATREAQPLLNSQGRIIGFFTWAPDWPMTAAIGRLMPLFVGLALCLVAFAGWSLTQLQRAQQELADSDAYAQIDKLTGLPNHDKMLALLDSTLAERTEDQVMTLAVIELDGIDGINDHLGQSGGDELVASAATRLRAALPADAICGRIGGDEFAVILNEQTDIGEVLRRALDAASRPLWTETAVRIGAHAGYAEAPHDGTSREELTRRADLALRAAKRKNPGSVVAFKPEIDAEFEEQQFIKRELTRALSTQALELHYQPIVAANGARIVGVEALLRWKHPDRGDISPAVFVPIAEQMGLMDALGEFVLRRALAEAMRWPKLFIAVNLSPLQVRGRGIVDLVRNVLNETKITPSRVVFEITEGVLINNPEEMKRRLKDLRALGVRIALDDFGSGYSSLSYLQQFPFDKLKIDRGFVTPLGRSANAGVIIQAIIALGRALGMSVLVEGVETEEQRVLLRLAGCDEMQGFLFARAVPAAAIGRLLSKSKAAPAADTPAVA
jgi:diguanylate cyclase (GGDEF)-like protein